MQHNDGWFKRTQLIDKGSFSIPPPKKKTKSKTHTVLVFQEEGKKKNEENTQALVAEDDLHRNVRGYSFDIILKTKKSLFFFQSGEKVGIQGLTN